MSNVRRFPWEYELANRLIDEKNDEYDRANLDDRLAGELRARSEPGYDDALYLERAIAINDAVERNRAPRHDGQRVLFDVDAVLALGDGRSVRLGAIRDRSQLDRAHATRTRQYHGQTVAYAAWTESYIAWGDAMDSTGLPLAQAIADDVDEASA